METAASNDSHDLHDKMEACRRAGVPQYVVWRVLDTWIAWFRLQNGAYVPTKQDAGGILESVVFPGVALGCPSDAHGRNRASAGSDPHASVALQGTTTNALRLPKLLYVPPMLLRLLAT